jgi:hypothetical protein
MMGERICAVDGCGKPVKARDWCNAHWLRWWRHGDPLTLLQRPDGTGTISKGYLVLRAGGKRINVQRQVMAEQLGRELESWEVVHHEDEDKLNNDPENLAVTTQPGHMRGHRSLAVWQQDHARFRSETEKECSRCHQVKSRDEFGKRTPRAKSPGEDPNQAMCKSCSAEYQKECKARRAA